MNTDEIASRLAIAQGEYVTRYREFQLAKAALHAVLDECGKDLDNLLPERLGTSRDSYIDLPSLIRSSGDTPVPTSVVAAISRIMLGLLVK